MLRFLLASLATLAALVVGVFVTRQTVTDGTDRFDGPERALAEEALAVSHIMTDNPLLSGVILARRVVLVAPERPSDCTEPGFAADGVYPGHKAEVVGYTLFRLPITRVSVTCGGTVYGLR